MVPDGVEGKAVGGKEPGCWLTQSLAGFSGWVHLAEIDPNEEVQGEIHLRLEVLPGTRVGRLRCSVLEAR